MTSKNDSVGLWMIGACGGVGATVALGLAAIRKNRINSTGLVTSQSAFRRAALPKPASIVVGGHEIRRESLLEAVRDMSRRDQLLDADLIRACAPQLRAWQKNIRAGTIHGAGTTVRNLAERELPQSERRPAAIVERLSDDIQQFRRRYRLDDVVVMNVASSEPSVSLAVKRMDHQAMNKALGSRRSLPIPPSALYGLAAIECGCALVNFTPSEGTLLPAVQERARALGVPYMGNDGKTGETLVKSALAPMFAARNLRVLSWVGQNILGNRDGAVLRDPRTRASKIRSKDRAVAAILGYAPTTGVSIEFVPSLDDRKVAWDFIHFEGFLGARMNLQFTWQGCDSILAAPLVIDLVRLAAVELRRGRGGPMRHLAFFFKDPLDCDEHGLDAQWRQLVQYSSTPS